MPLSKDYKVGTRASRLSVLQTRQALARLQERVPALTFAAVTVSSPGDRDLATDLRESPPDFFTRDLDEAIRAGTIDLAVHSAKDVPDPMPADLDWFWLPWRADPREALVLRPGMTVQDLPRDPVLGVSSARREAYARARFPGARLKSIRGPIEARLRQLDEGGYDVLIMAGAALERLELLDRVTEWIPVTDLTPPEGQGCLAVTYRKGNPVLTRLRSLFVQAVRFVSAGVGDAAHLTLAGRRALSRAEVCLHDTLLDPSVLDFLPDEARRIDVGKRCGRHPAPQEEITHRIADEARKGLRVVRLKGGDAGLFGRLAEELDALDGLSLPYEILPGVSSLTAATTGTGLLLTRRGVSRGFCALTPRGAGGSLEPVGASARGALPIVCFMALEAVAAVVKDLLNDGRSADTPAAVVWDAGGVEERVVRTTLAALASAVAGAPASAAGLLIVGEVCRYGRTVRTGALRGARVLLTCSEDLQERAADAVRDLGGVPIRWPLVRLRLRPEAVDAMRGLDAVDWLVLTSPAAVRCFLSGVDRLGLDARRLPRLLACGPGTAAGLRAARLAPDAVPESNCGAEGAIEMARKTIRPGERVLRLRSQKAGGELAAALAAQGALVTDLVLYDNEPVRHASCPAFDVVFFASASAVESWVEQGYRSRLEGVDILTIGEPTAHALRALGLSPTAIGEPATVAGAMNRLAAFRVGQDLGGVQR